MSLIFDESVDAPTDPPRGIPSGATITNDEVVRRSKGGGRVALVIVMVMVAAGVAAMNTGLVSAASPPEPFGNRSTVDTDHNDDHDHDHDGEDQDEGHDVDHDTYRAQSAAVEPPLPGVQPAGTFDPVNSVANYDASIVAAVAGRRLVYTEPGGPVNEHWANLPPGFDLRAVSPDGMKAALVAVNTDSDGHVTDTEILIADRSGEPVTVTVHHLDGLIEPEAFATDARSLFVIDHQAASEPGSYRIRPLNLETGELEAMLGPTKTPLIEDMNGRGRRQMWGLGDGRLYTLYIRQTDHIHASGHPGSDGFVHILDLNEEWAFCLDLPSTFGKGDLNTTALAVGATRLAVLDLSAGEGGQLAYASTADRAVTVVIDLPLSFRRTMKAMLVDAADHPGRPADRQPTVHLAMYGTAIAVGVGDALVWFDGATLEPLGDDPDNAYRDRIALDGLLLGLTTVGGNGVLAWTIGGQGPEQLNPPPRPVP